MCACRGTAGFAHVSCLAEQAKILVAEAEENNLGPKAENERWARWYTCSLCEQKYHGVVSCALGWACWKTCVGQSDAEWTRSKAMNQLGQGLDAARHHEDALSVQEAALSTLQRRVDAPAQSILIAQTNLANTYDALRRHEDALRMSRDVYSGRLKLSGEEHRSTIIAANNYAASLNSLDRFEEAKSVLRKMTPVARRVLGESHQLTLKMKWTYAAAHYEDTGATLDGLREAVTTLEETARTARRVLGDAHPTVSGIERGLQNARARAALAAREAAA